MLYEDTSIIRTFLVRDQEAVGSNPVAPTMIIKGFSAFGEPLFFCF